LPRLLDQYDFFALHLWLALKGRVALYLKRTVFSISGGPATMFNWA
jgi:hypothetical protein